MRPDSVELADQAASWRSAYVHIPFCRKRCPYCDFAVVAPGDPVAVDLDALTLRYLDALHAEIDLETEWEPLDAVNFGGGTPTAVGAKAIAKLIAHLEGRFGLAPEAEISVEANPEDITYDLLEGLIEAGVNRVSLGVQSFDDAVLATLGRTHRARTAAEAVSLCIEAGLSVSVDLILGTPGESTESWSATVDAALSLQTHHLSAYALTVEPGTELWKQVRSGAAAPDDDDQAEKYEYLQTRATPAGLVQYEVSNYAAPGHVCRYNLATWGQAEYFGFGLGAHRHRGGVRSRNVRSINAYVAALEEGQRPEAGRDLIVDTEMERLVLGLRRSCGVALGPWRENAKSDPGIQRLVAAGVVSIDGGRLRVVQPLLADAVGVAVLSLSR